MAPRKWADLTWEEVRDLDRHRAVALLPVGAIEAHGPHLPLATDVLLAEAMAEAAAARLEAKGHPAILLPAIPYAAAPFGAGFPGTVSVRAESVKALVLDLARELTRQGSMVAYVDVFHLMFYITLACIPMLLIMRAPRREAGGEPLHAAVD